MTMISIEAGLIVASSLKALSTNNSTLLFKHMSCIYYPIYFKKDQVEIRALLDSGNEVNTMTQTYAAKLGLEI